MTKSKRARSSKVVNVNTSTAASGAGVRKTSTRKKKNRLECKRVIYFYRAYIKDTTDNKAARQLMDHRLLFPAYQSIDKTECHTHDEETGLRFCIASCEVRNNRTYIEFAKSRTRVISREEVDSQLTPIQLSPKGGLADTIHAVFYENGLVAIEYNFDGPRPNRLSEYFALKCPQIPEFQLYGCLTMAGAKKLETLENFRGMKLKILKDDVPSVKAFSGTLHKIFADLEKALDVEEIELTLKVTRQSKSTLPLHIASIVSKATTKPEFDAFAKKLKVLARPIGMGRSAWFDFGKNQIHQQATMMYVDESHGALDSAHVFQEIDSAFLFKQLELTFCTTLLDD